MWVGVKAFMPLNLEDSAICGGCVLFCHRFGGGERRDLVYSRCPGLQGNEDALVSWWARSRWLLETSDMSETHRRDL